MNHIIIGFEKRAEEKEAFIRSAKAFAKRPGLVTRMGKNRVTRYNLRQNKKTMGTPTANEFFGRVPGGTWKEKYQAAKNAPVNKYYKRIGQATLATGALAGAGYGAKKLLTPPKEQATAQWSVPQGYA